jgi:hypothetical protein
MTGSYKVYFYGITFRTAGTLNDSLIISYADGSHYEYENCYLWSGTSGSTSHIQIGQGDAQVFTKLKNTTIRFGSTAQRLRVFGKVVLEGCTLSSAGTAPASLIDFSGADPAGSQADLIGCDLAHLGANNLVDDSTSAASTARFFQCKLGASFSMSATQTNTNRSSAEVYVYDCASGDTHGLFGYKNGLGSVVSDTGIYFTSGAAAQSWKVVTTASASLYTPFETPFIDWYNTSLSALTPYIEILRDGSATAAGAGTGSWTGEAGTAWSGKIGLGSSITPAENGHIRARIAVGEPSITVYVDPQIRV